VLSNRIKKASQDVIHPLQSPSYRTVTSSFLSDTALIGYYSISYQNAIAQIIES
jgi:hypothetical protein